MLKTFLRSFRSKEETSVIGVECWSVRWTSVQGQYHNDKKEVAEFFTSEDDAKEFKKALIDAFKLTRNNVNSILLKKESTA